MSDLPSHPIDAGLPHREQSAENLSVIVGMAGTVLTAAVTVYGVFHAAGGDAGLAWMAILGTWAVYALSMGALWFATADESR